MNILKQVADFLATLDRTPPPVPSPLAAVAVGATVCFDTYRVVNGKYAPFTFRGTVTEADTERNAFGELWAWVEYSDERGETHGMWLESAALTEMEG